ncbi:transposase [Bdellovibrionota bacterium FG-2]
MQARLRWQIPAPVWSQIKPLIPPGSVVTKKYTSRQIMNTILFKIRTESNWSEIQYFKGMVPAYIAKKQLKEWVNLGIIQQLPGLKINYYDPYTAMNWEWVSRSNPTA